MTRWAGLFESLRRSPSLEVRVMALLAGRDKRTVTGSNVSTLEAISGLDIWSVRRDTLREALIVATTVDTPPSLGWKIGYLQRLLIARGQARIAGDKLILEL